MNKKKSPKRRKPEAGQNPRKELFIKGFLCALVCLWMFILGLLVGRGTAPVLVDVEQLQDKLARLKAATIEDTVKRYQVALQDLDKKKNLGFHEELKNEETRLPSVAPSSAASSSVSEGDQTNRAPAKTEAPALKKTKDSEFKKPPVTETPGEWAIQVAATQDEAEGGKLVERLEKMGYRTYLVKAEITGKGTWYRIQVLGYESRKAAEVDLAKLKKERFSPIIVSPSK